MERVLMQDMVPYDLPSSLEALNGSGEGVLVLPHSVHWGPQRLADLAEPADVSAAYQALVREGTSFQQESLLNADLLRRVWPALVLPERCRRLWESRFSDLTG